MHYSGDYCWNADDIDKARAEAAKERAEERLKNKTENLDVNRAQYSLRRAIARLGAYNKLGRWSHTTIKLKPTV